VQRKLVIDVKKFILKRTKNINKKLFENLGSGIEFAYFNQRNLKSHSSFYQFLSISIRVSGGQKQTYF